jgi:RHS repeat-associated protein
LNRLFPFLFLLLLCLNAFAFAPEQRSHCERPTNQTNASRTTDGVAVTQSNGGYGSMQGVGGLEAVNENGTQRTLVSDSCGNVLAAFANFQPAQINWNESRPTAYGYVPGCRPPTLGAGVSYAEAASWRGRVIDITGLSCLGLRHYEPGSGRFLSYDSAWNAGDPNGYSFCGGDPVNRFDPTGRFGKQAWAYGSGFAEGAGIGAWNEAVGVAKFAKGITYGLGEQISYTAMDAYGAYTGSEDDYQSAMFNGVFNQSLAGRSNWQMAGETGLELSGYRFGNQIFDNLEQGAQTGDYSQFSQNMGIFAAIAGSPSVASSIPRAERIFTQTEDIQVIANSGRVWGQTEGSVYGMAVENASRFRSMADPMVRDPGLVVFDGNAASLFQPHPVEGIYSGLKAALGQYKAGFGDIVFDPKAAQFNGTTLTISDASLGSHMGQSELWAASRLWGRRGLDAGLTLGAGYSLFDPNK